MSWSDGTIRLETLAPSPLEGLAELGRDPDVQRFTYVPSPWEDGFETCGFVREGVLRSLHFKQGQRADIAVYSRLAGDGA